MTMTEKYWVVRPRHGLKSSMSREIERRIAQFLGNPRRRFSTIGAANEALRDAIGSGKLSASEIQIAERQDLIF